MRVTHLVPALFARDDGIVGGAERYAYELARHMARDTETRLVTFGNRPRVERDGELAIEVLPLAHQVRGQRSNPFTWRLFAALRDADVMHCHQRYIVATTAAAAWARVTGRRVFVSDLGGGGWDFSRYVPTDAWFHGHLHISAYSRRMAGHEGRPDAHVIYGGVDTGRFAPDAGEARDGGVLFVGRILPHKGVNDLVAAVPPDVGLEIVGPAPDDRFLDDLKRLARGKRVTFRHDVTDHELVTAYRRATCVILPSVYRDTYGRETAVPELLGQTLLEAMACGTPAVGTRVASLPEVVDDGVTGFIVSPNAPDELRDRILRLEGDRALVDRMGAAGRRRVLDHFTWPAVVERCLGLYHGA